MFGLRSQSHPRQTMGNPERLETLKRLFFFFLSFFSEFAALLYSCVINLEPQMRPFLRTGGGERFVRILLRLTSESETSSFLSRQLRVAAALPFIRVKFSSDKEPDQPKPPLPKLPSICSLFLLICYTSTTLTKKNFHLFSRPHLCSSAFPHPAITER